MAGTSSDIGAQEFFRGAAAARAQGFAGEGSMEQPPQPAGTSSRGSRPIVMGEEAVAGGWGRGPVPVDPRKYRYDRTRALGMQPVGFAVTKADRLDAQEAGDVLHKIHVSLGIDREDESRIAAFDAALWWEHTINGASVLQESRGTLSVGGMEFDISSVLKMIGETKLRRFFRAYADDILEVNREVIRGYSPYDFVAAEKYGQLMQVAAARGLHKYPELAFDAADACTEISLEARRALQTSKSIVIPQYNNTDRPFIRTGAGTGGTDDENLHK
jgi:hypothetical protein